MADFRQYKPGRRRSRGLPPKPLVLIVCEGKETEPNYFNGIRQSKKISKDRIKVLGSDECGGTDPKTIVECAKKVRKQSELNYDEIWCVFDRDGHHRFHEAIIQAHDNKFKVAFSNPCFELWCLLHFTDQTAHIEGQKAHNDLRLPGRLPDYEKGMPNLCNKLSSCQSEAIHRARKLRDMHRRNENQETTNPATAVDKLVDFLNRMK